MKTVTVIAAMGATLRGPARLKLSKEQAECRKHLVRETGKGGVVEIDGNAELQFKFGESFGLEGPERLNRALFSYEEAATKKAKGGAAAPADSVPVEGDAVPEGPEE